MDGYRTMDGIDLNDLWYGDAGIRSAIDTYQEVSLPVLDAMAMVWPETIMKYTISSKNGFQLLAGAQLPDAKQVQFATMYPHVMEKHGYGVSTDVDTLRRSTGREIMIDIGRPMKEDNENVLLQMLKVIMVDPGADNVGYGLYNGEFSPEEKLSAPPRYQQNTFASDHTHYVVAASPGSPELTDITMMKQTIRHHGNNGALIVLINSTEVQLLEDLAAWNQSGIVRNPITDEVAVNGFKDRFQLLGVVFHSTEMVPPGYWVMCEISSAEEERMLVHYEPQAIPGLQLYPGSMADYPLINSTFARWMGFKVWRRGAACVLDTTNQSYTSPTLT